TNGVVIATEKKRHPYYQVDPSGYTGHGKLTAIGKNMISAKTFLEKRIIRIRRCCSHCYLTLKEGYEGQMTENTVEIGICQMEEIVDTR
ncbi:hypothetical protein BCR36DRAFT_588570, partial [Piromyces finnis]